MAATMVDEYLDAVPAEQRVVLDRLRELIRAAAPEAVEGIAYAAPAYRLDGRYLVGFASGKRNCSFYTGRAPLDAHALELAGFRLWKGTINFTPDRPLPDDLVTQLVRDRVGEFRRGTGA